MSASSGDLTTRLVHHLRCPVCSMVCQPPIYMCSNGHNVCAKCKDRVFECAVCRIFLPYVRNLFAEEFYNQITIACKNDHLGCARRFGFSDIKAHEGVCPFNYKCFFCQTQTGYKDILEHIKEEHMLEIRSSGHVMTANEICLGQDMESAMVICINTDLVYVSLNYLCESKKFMLNVAMSAPNQEGRDNEFSNLSCKLKFDSKDQAERLSYRCRIRRSVTPQAFCVIASDTMEMLAQADKLSYVFYVNSRDVTAGEGAVVSFA